MKRDKVLTACAALVGLAAVVASFSTLASLGAYVGWQGRSSWLLPLCIDALATGAGRVWLSGRYDAAARRYARGVSMAAVSASVAGNTVGHLVALDDTGGVRVTLAILVGAVPPIALAAVGHLLTLATARGTDPAAERTAERVPAAERVHAGPVLQHGPGARDLGTVTLPPVPLPPEMPPDGPASTRKAGRTASRSGTGNRDKARALWDRAPADAKPTGAELARAIGVDASLGRRWRREFVGATP